MEKNIRLTKKKIKEIFDECNSLYFNSKVPSPQHFELWTPNKNVVGWVRCGWNGKAKRYETFLHISNKFHWNKTDLVNTMVHEMIHLLIEDYKKPLPLWKRWFGMDHDKEFKSVMKDLNSRFNLNISVKVPYMEKKRKQ